MLKSIRKADKGVKDLVDQIRDDTYARCHLPSDLGEHYLEGKNGPSLSANQRRSPVEGR